MPARDPNRKYNIMNQGPERGDTVKYYWTKEWGKWALIRIIHRRKDKMTLWDIQEEISEKEYFRRKLRGTLHEYRNTNDS